MTKWRERVYCGEIDLSHAGKGVLLMGWVDAIRDHGNVLFIHLRDIRGIVQVVFDPRGHEGAYEKASSLKEEYVVEVTGMVTTRARGTENPNIRTGEVEVVADTLTILSASRVLPFQISEKAMVLGEEIKANPDKVDEDLRLQYRYLDLRRPSMQENFRKRYQILRSVREVLDRKGFMEIETPFLTKSTPEGARDYLVPSRVHPGKFYSLPQSPQLFKQLLMLSGLDRYFQIARCFRDEDLRPNRQPEFTQLDLEASFIDEAFIYDVIEELTVTIFAIGDIALTRPFPRMTYEEAMERYGSDRPDLRFDMAFEDVTGCLKDTDYAIFKSVIEAGGLIKGFCIRGQAGALSKNVLQNEIALRVVPSLGGKGMSWMKVRNGKLESNIVQFFRPKELEGLIRCFDAQEGDVLIMIADRSPGQMHEVLGRLRLHMAERLGMIPPDRYCPLWVTDFPLFEEKESGLGSQHHPFTMPDRTDFDPYDKEDLLRLKSRAYDLVMNGEELGGGSIRIHRMDLQKKIFQALSLDQDEIENKFGFFLRALEFGAPPHGGLALGMDRVIAMILKSSSIREVIAFPKNRSAFCPLSQAPSFVDPSQIKELGLSEIQSGLGKQTDLKSPPKGGTQREAAISDRVGAQKITGKDFDHLVSLARLNVSSTEAASLHSDLNAVLDYVETLKNLDTHDVPPMSHVLQLKNAWREDEPVEPAETEGILSKAPRREDRFFRVPRII